jgi:hypothetical protein
MQIFTFQINWSLKIQEIHQEKKTLEVCKVKVVKDENIEAQSIRYRRHFSTGRVRTGADEPRNVLQ